MPRVFWLPFITVISGIMGSLCESALGRSNGVGAWLLRASMPLWSGLLFLALTQGGALADAGADQRRVWRELVFFTLFSVPAWVGIYAVRMSRDERADRGDGTGHG